MTPAFACDLTGGRRRAIRTSGRAWLLWALLALVTGPGHSTAQEPRWEVDLNASRIQFDTAATRNAPSISGLLEWRRPALFARVRGSVTGFENAGWSTQGRGDLAGWLTPFGAVSPFRLELAGTGSASRHSSGFDSFLGQANARLHLLGRSVGGWVGAGGGVARNSLDTTSVTGFVPTAGVWAQGSSVRATATYLHKRVSGETFPEASLVLAFSEGPVDLSVYGGLRDFPVEGLETETWAGGSAAFWFRDDAAVIVSGGQYSSDILQGLPGGDFISVGIRLTARRDRPIPRRVTTPIVYTVEHVRDEGITLEVPDASRVEIAGDFNGWTLERLEQAPTGGWIVPATLEPGVYRFNLRVDGERWIVPEGVPEVDDGFGDRVGLLIISENGGS